MWHRVQTVSTTAPDTKALFLFWSPDACSTKGARIHEQFVATCPEYPDVLVRNEGTVFFCPLTSRGKQWIEEHVQPDALWFGSALVVEHRCAWGLAQGLKDAGLVLA